MSDISGSRQVDLPTVAAIAAMVYLASVLAHEAGGHGGACVALGLKPLEWGAYYFDCHTQEAPVWQARLVAAAGSSVNLVLAILCALGLKARGTAKPGVGAAALWLLFMVNALTWAGYFLFSGIANIGDWSTQTGGVLEGLLGALGWAARAAMALAGGLFYFLIIRLGGQWLGTVVGGARRDLARRLAITAYLTGGITAVAIGLLNPLGWFIVLASAAASTLGGTNGLLYTPRYMAAEPAETAFTLPRNWLVILTGLAATGLYAAILGRSISFAGP